MVPIKTYFDIHNTIGLNDQLDKSVTVRLKKSFKTLFLSYKLHSSVKSKQTMNTDDRQNISSVFIVCFDWFLPDGRFTCHVICTLVHSEILLYV